MNNELLVSGGARKVQSIDKVVVNIKTQVKEQHKQPKHPKEEISTECSKFQSMFEVELDKLGKLEAYMKDSGRL